MVGGAIGADGIHGATFSSLALDENAPATAVQIGDAITQKRAMDFLLEARDLGPLYLCDRQWCWWFVVFCWGNGNIIEWGDLGFGSCTDQVP